jgi:valyl-tRNA synthetase
MPSDPLQEIHKTYDPEKVEERLYQWWESSGFFIPSIDPSKKPFTIIMPPPNVTGELHVGHALTATVEDALVRYHRMLGDPTLWIPGTDHAGIATQLVVERELAKEGLSRHDLGRERFVQRIWSWVAKYGDAIDNQHRRLGASCDWTRRQFTLDPGPSRSVRTTFVNLYKKGLIYRGERIINWCPSCRTALSELEVDHEEEQGSLYYIRYRLRAGDGHVTVATTRPETLLGDVAVAVHPDDPRFQHLKGQWVTLPVLGRPIPVIQDEAVAMEFGTGALKITPGHDPNDFETGQRHNLPIINIMNPDGTLNPEAGPYNGYDRYDARKAIVEQLEHEGLLERVELHTHAVGHCQRSGDVLEPIASKQWFVHVEPLAKRAMEAVTNGSIRIVPERFVRVYLNWMENIRDWCISRQLWWGHRIPVWYCVDCAHLTVAIDDPVACGGCGSVNISQDEDVLDTWFSSGLWPHSTLGWPDDTEDLRYFYPTSIMETGYDILFFWIARMVMLGLENMDQVPFHTVYLHGLIRDEQGRKMSKTTGNVIDPVEAIKQYGTDALRFALTTGTAPGNDSRVSPAKLQAARNFTNKLWNAARYVLTPLEGASGLEGWSDSPPRSHREDRWVLGRLDQVTSEVGRLWNELQLGEAQRVLHDFIWGEFCDWYIELAKVRIRSGDLEPQQVLAHVLERLLRLLHPFMPFITEELWQQLIARLPQKGDLPRSIMLAPYPTPSIQADDVAMDEMGLVTDVVRSIRNVRAEFRVGPQQRLDAVIATPEGRHVLEEEADAIRQLARVGSIAFTDERATVSSNAESVTVVVRRTSVTLLMAGLVDLTAERQRMQTEMEEGQTHLRRLSMRLADVQFISKAPTEVVEREHERLEALQQRQERLGQLLSEMGS